jgi:endonuclease YncB( thermonuclease family)|tara:strand:- start:7414 stop:7965 length:552 start_codon:yes stop_codon:yes gene_type:complete
MLKKLLYIPIITLVILSSSSFGQQHHFEGKDYNRSLLGMSNFADLDMILYGKAVVTDGDSLRISGRRIRLLGIDAPELKQKCINNIGLFYLCGQKSKNVLLRKISSKIIICRFKNTDRYGRVLSVCWVDKININSWLVTNGYAVAYRRYSSAFIKDEMKARSTKKGLWSGEFEMPESWRQNNR